MAGPVCINTTDAFGVLLNAITVNITGSIFLTLLFITILLVAMSLAAGLPTEWTAIIILPFVLYSWACSGDFMQIGGFLLIYLGFIMAKFWVFSK